MQSRSPISLSIRQKLVLVSLSLLIIPWVGYEYVNEMEEYLQIRQEQRLLERARILASLLADKPELFSTKLSTLGDTSGSKHLYVRPLTSPIHIDGHTKDWRDYKERIFEFSDPNVKPSDLSFKFQVGSYKPFLYVLFRVTDNKFMLRSKSGVKWRAEECEAITGTFEISSTCQNASSLTWEISTITPVRFISATTSLPKGLRPFH